LPNSATPCTHTNNYIHSHTCLQPLPLALHAYKSEMQAADSPITYISPSPPPPPILITSLNRFHNIPRCSQPPHTTPYEDARRSGRRRTQTTWNEPDFPSGQLMPAVCSATMSNAPDHDNISPPHPSNPEQPHAHTTFYSRSLYTSAGMYQIITDHTRS